MKLSLFAFNVECDVAVTKVTKNRKLYPSLNNNNNTTAPFVRCIEVIKIQVSNLFLHETTYSAHNLIYGSGWVSFLWWFSNFLDKLR